MCNIFLYCTFPDLLLNTACFGCKTLAVKAIDNLKRLKYITLIINNNMSIVHKET